MVKRLLTHRLFAPALVTAIFGLGAATVALLRFGPGLAPWADTLLTACFGWNAETRRYRLDALLLAVLQPPLFATVVGFFYLDDLRAFLGSRSGRIVAVLAPAVFAGLAVSLLATGEISASGVPPTFEALQSPLRRGAPAPAFTLIDQQGQAVSLESLKGRVVALTFVYANCHESCPLLIQRLKALEARTPGADVVFVAVSLDPERDTPAALRAVATQWELGNRWHLLTGDPAAVQRVLRDYGIQWAPLPEGEIAHANVILLIDRRGRLAFTYRGLAHPEEGQAAELSRLASERS
ncbi:MAG TPA: SCO family protein [Methylomirabilota bacterium]|nr:SCO family protein [Methylomirabilota bacterium]